MPSSLFRDTLRLASQDAPFRRRLIAALQEQRDLEGPLRWASQKLSPGETRVFGGFEASWGKSPSVQWLRVKELEGQKPSVFTVEWFGSNKDPKVVAPLLAPIYLQPNFAAALRKAKAIQKMVALEKPFGPTSMMSVVPRDSYRSVYEQKSPAPARKPSRPYTEDELDMLPFHVRQEQERGRSTSLQRPGRLYTEDELDMLPFRVRQEQERRQGK